MVSKCNVYQSYKVSTWSIKPERRGVVQYNEMDTMYQISIVKQSTPVQGRASHSRAGSVCGFPLCGLRGPLRVRCGAEQGRVGQSRAGSVGGFPLCGLRGPLRVRCGAEQGRVGQSRAGSVGGFPLCELSGPE